MNMTPVCLPDLYFFQNNFILKESFVLPFSYPGHKDTIEAVTYFIQVIYIICTKTSRCLACLYIALDLINALMHLTMR